MSWSAGRLEEREVSMWAEIAAFVDPMPPVIAIAALINWNKNAKYVNTLVFTSLSKDI
jgi:hypothetical protein